MPKSTKGAPARANTAKSRKAGGPSPKHRGYQPEAEKNAAPAKKSRWSADERAAKGRAPERPRGGAQSRDRDGLEGRRPQRAADGRPNWEPRGKDARTERPARERAPRRYDDRAPRSYDRDDRPARAFDDRVPRRYDRDERPAPRRYDRDERPAARRYERDERPAARRYDRDERPAARRYDRDERPAARRYDDERSAAPRPAPQDDVVLERLEAQAIEATDVAGITFGDLGLGQNIVRELRELGAETPFPIQAATIPDVLSGSDVLGRGRTGSGKTIAFGAPLVERLLQLQAGSTERRKPGRAPRALILAPTRELALQIDRTVQPIARSVGLFTTQIYGGVPYARQIGALQRGVDIVIGTPGRVEDLVEQGRLDLSNVTITVLDEADHMCELGFYEPVQRILRHTAEGGQKLLFSATLDTRVASIVEEFLVAPKVHEVAGEDQASSTIEHRVLLLDQRDKRAVLSQLASGRGPILVFARTRAFAEELADMLDDEGVDAVSLHGDLTQSRRQRALERLSSGRATVLVATDVAARGIHIDDIALVIQADAPDEYKTYLHRSGRTGRAGKSGTVVTLVPRNRRRRTEELLARAEIEAEWTSVVPGDAIIAELAAR